jgi:AcrR family transcriptional regulator
VRATNLTLPTVILLVGVALAQAPRPGAPLPGPSWRFVVSGDSRNCGDVVVPAIAAKARASQPAFYWHLGDLRKIYDFDEDMQHQPEHLARPMTIIDYENQAWDDYIENQIVPFAPIPVFVGIGNHETISPKTRQDFIEQFADWLDAPVLQQQRLRDNPKDRRLKAYYHWIDRGIDFISMDNATADQFDAAQMRWVKEVLERDKRDPAIRSIVVGMHRALPDSISADHSMNESASGTQSGREVYRELVDAQNTANKRIYVLASHSHFYMDGIFNTAYWRANGGVLPGWIVGTAGAVRYALPENSKDARSAETNVYGYLEGTVSGGDIQFSFQRLTEQDVPAAVVNRYKPEFVHWCFAENTQANRQ